MMRFELCVGVAMVIAPLRAEASDCLSTCGDVCYAQPDSAFFRVEVIDPESGSARVVERLGGASSVDVAVGAELGEVWGGLDHPAGEQLFVTVSANTDNGSPYVWGQPWLIRADQVICNEDETQNVPLVQYVAMASSNACLATAEDLHINNRCSVDDGGCSTAGGSGGALTALVALALCRRRRHDPA